jgi:broad specificity phosphatase PhoE
MGGLVGLTARLDAQRGPLELVLVRHGESIGNLADDEARQAGADELDLEHRDADVPLSDEGQAQARALRRQVGRLSESNRPALVVSSPFRRAADTARTAFAGTGTEIVLDERLRERDLGLLDGFTSTGIRSRYPEEVERRKKLGKFYYQPPSGESWADVVLRTRSFLADLREGYDGARVWLFTHQAVIMSYRYVLEELDEARLLEIDRETRIPNASLTTYRRTERGLVLESFADSSTVEQSGADRTAEPVRAGHGAPDHG